MKRLFTALFFISLGLVGLGQNDTAYKYILDYQVPASPGFTILDATPQQVTRGSAAKPLVVNLFTNYLQTQRLDPGIALDFSPYVLLGGGFKNIDEYQKSGAKRILANTLLSVATIKNQLDSGNTDIGAGIRITLFDDHDLFSNSTTAKKVTQDIGQGLAGAASATVTPGGVPDDQIGAPVPVDLSKIYTDAYKSLQSQPGWASSIGFGYRTTAKSSTLKSDSLINQQYKIWYSLSRYRIFKGADLLSIVQGTLGPHATPEWIAGAALASQNKTSNMGAEVVYNFQTKELEYGATFEIRLFKQLSYIVSLGKRSVNDGNTTTEKFRVISSFRYNLFTH